MVTPHRVYTKNVAQKIPTFQKFDAFPINFLPATDKFSLYKKNTSPDTHFFNFLFLDWHLFSIGTISLQQLLSKPIFTFFKKEIRYFLFQFLYSEKQETFKSMNAPCFNTLYTYFSPATSLCNQTPP